MAPTKDIEPTLAQKPPFSKVRDRCEAIVEFAQLNVQAGGQLVLGPEFISKNTGYAIAFDRFRRHRSQPPLVSRGHLTRV
jgi:hypothetical protein